MNEETASATLGSEDYRRAMLARELEHRAFQPPEEVETAASIGKWLTGPVATDDYGQEVPHDASSLMSLINSLVPHPGQNEEQMTENTLGFLLPSGGTGAMRDLARGPVGESVARIFAGPGARTADHQALAQAKLMAEGGADNEAVRAGTGWFQGPDQKWRFEIDDSGSRPGPRTAEEGEDLANRDRPTTSRQGALLHPQLSAAYPDTKRIGVTLDRDAGDTGAYTSTPIMGDLLHENIRVGTDPNFDANRSTMLHELQHAIQQREGFARGGTPDSAAHPFFKEINSELDKKLSIISKKMDQGGSDADALRKQYDDVLASKLDEPYDAYQKLAGEVEARDVQARMDFTPEQRAATAPYSSQGIAPEDMTVSFGNGPSLMTVYHGTPHKFAPTENNPLGEFDASKIGTGEGAQAFGHGVYMAEHPDVAGAYLKGNAANPEISYKGESPMAWALGNREQYEAMSESQRAALKYLTDYKDLDSASKAASDYGRMDVADALKQFAPDVAKASPGNLYKADLPDEHIAKMLDWDKALGDQPESMQQFLPVIQRGIDEGWSTLKNASDATGEDLYAALRDQAVGWKTGANVPLMDERAAASEALRQAGIPGIRYLDQGSREAGEGTSNFVAFDPSIARILELMK